MSGPVSGAVVGPAGGGSAGPRRTVDAVHPGRVRRVSVIGTSGSGKTTFARALAGVLGVPHVELDAIVHQADWQELPDEAFGRRVEEITRADGWVTCGNYRRIVPPIVWPRADTVVWLDLPKRTVMRRITWRTIRRVVTREELWNGNREPLVALAPWNRDQSMVWWAWSTFDERRAAYERAMDDPKWAEIEFVRLRSPREARGWLATLPVEP